MLGSLDLPVDLGQAFLAAHGQQGVSETNQHGNRGNAGSDGSLQPPQGLITEIQVSRRGRRHRLVTVLEDRDQAPDDQDYHHHRGDLHNPQRLCAGEGNANSIAVPEVEGNQSSKSCREERSGNLDPVNLEILLRFVD